MSGRTGLPGRGWSAVPKVPSPKGRVESDDRSTGRDSVAGCSAGEADRRWFAAGRRSRWLRHLIRSRRLPARG